jgi:hypothetical protein
VHNIEFRPGPVEQIPHESRGDALPPARRRHVQAANAPYSWVGSEWVLIESTDTDHLLSRDRDNEDLAGTIESVNAASPFAHEARDHLVTLGVRNGYESRERLNLPERTNVDAHLPNDPAAHRP